MLTDLEINTINSFIRLNTDGSVHYLATGSSGLKVSKDTNTLIDYFRDIYNRENKCNIGKSAYLFILLKQFAIDQKDLLEAEGISPDDFNKTVLSALQFSKKIFRKYCSDSIRSASDGVVSILVYSVVHQSNEKVVQYSTQRENPVEEIPSPVVIPDPPMSILPSMGEEDLIIPESTPVVSSDISDLFEDDTEEEVMVKPVSKLDIIKDNMKKRRLVVVTPEENIPV